MNEYRQKKPKCRSGRENDYEWDQFQPTKFPGLGFNL